MQQQRIVHQRRPRNEMEKNAPVAQYPASDAIDNVINPNNNNNYLPTISISPVWYPVWNDGASADTSQLNLPDMLGSTAFNET